MPAFDELLEGFQHHLCVRHLYVNIKTRCSGGTIIMDLVLAAAKATYVQAWQEKMA